MQSKAYLHSLYYDNGKQYVSFDFKDDLTDWADEYAGKELNIKIEPYKEKRSLDANAYFWRLVDEIAEKMKRPKEELYRGYIKQIGGVSDIYCCQNKAVARLRNTWSERGIGWFTEVEESKLPNCTNVILYFGSSCYNKEQMSDLIDLAVQDAKSIGIVVMNEQERSLLLDAFDNN